jgi:hypothetical protein
MNRFPALQGQDQRYLALVAKPFAHRNANTGVKILMPGTEYLALRTKHSGPRIMLPALSIEESERNAQY